MHKHNIDFAFGYDLINPDGKVVKSVRNEAEPTCEGKVGYQILNKRKEVVYEHEQSMQSFTTAFLKAFVQGYRLAKRNDSFITLPNLIGHSRTDSKVYVQNIKLIAPYNNYSTSAWTTSSVDSTTSGFVLDSLSTTSNSIRTVFHVERNITSGSGSITETALYSCNQPTVSSFDDWSEGMIARDTFSSGYSFGVGSFVRITWTLDFPFSTNKSLTMNWVKNFIQNIVDTDYTDFKQLDGTSVTGVGASSNVTGQTFTKEANCRGGAGVDNKGIVIGTSNISVSQNDYSLGSQISHGTGSGQMEYGVSGTTNSVAVIYPTQGKANVSYSREFKNSSGSTVTVKEAGLVANTASTSEGVATAGSYLLARWLTQDIAVPNDYTLKIYFQPTVTATAEDHSNLSGVIVVTDEMRAAHPAFKNLSMIQSQVQSSKTWVQAKQYAASLTLAGYSDWRLPRQRDTNKNDVEDNELYKIWNVYYSQMTGWSGSCWSDNQYSTSNAYTVDNCGNVDGYVKSNSCNCFCVR